MRCAKLRNFFLVTIFSGFYIIGCQAENSSVTPTRNILPSLIPSATLSPIQEPTTVSSIQVSTPACVDTEKFNPMSEDQIEYIHNHDYNYLFTSNEKTKNHVYSVNRANIICSPGYGSPGNYNTWRLISGFVVDLNQPQNTALYPHQESYIYVKARFIGYDGTTHDYWLQLIADLPSHVFGLVQWDKPIAETKNQPGLDAISILLTGKNSDGTDISTPLKDIPFNGLLRLNDQFIAIIYIGTTDNQPQFSSSQYGKHLNQFINAIEGNADFPLVGEGFYLRVQDAMIVPVKP